MIPFNSSQAKEQQENRNRMNYLIVENSSALAVGEQGSGVNGEVVGRIDDDDGGVASYFIFTIIQGWLGLRGLWSHPHVNICFCCLFYILVEEWKGVRTKEGRTKEGRTKEGRKDEGRKDVRVIRYFLLFQSLSHSTQSSSMMKYFLT
jgi:hypothetical protein